jgi:hypothetical protein
MIRFFALIVVCGMLLVAGTAAQTVRAQSEEPSMTEEQINHIRQNCVRAQSVLNQMHASDALLRVNRGRLYELISTKLMAPLNSRIALNRLGGLKLPATTLEYDRQLDAFRNDYQQYEEAMSRTLDIRCANQPVAFYDSLKDTREKRLKVHADTVALNTLLQTYKTDFEEFVKEMQKDSQ